MKRINRLLGIKGDKVTVKPYDKFKRRLSSESQSVTGTEQIVHGTYDSMFGHVGAKLLINYNLVNFRGEEICKYKYCNVHPSVRLANRLLIFSDLDVYFASEVDGKVICVSDKRLIDLSKYDKNLRHGDDPYPIAFSNECADISLADLGEFRRGNVSLMNLVNRSIDFFKIFSTRLNLDCQIVKYSYITDVIELNLKLDKK